MTTRANGRKLLSMLILVVGMAGGTAAKAAAGFEPNCIVGDVTIADDTWGRALFIHCGNINKDFYAYLRIDTTIAANMTCTLADGGTAMSGSPPHANTPNAAAVDDVKMWQTIAEAGYLSGRTVEVSYTVSTTSCTSNLIRAVGMH
jgi:hypothetical protein